MNAYDVAIVGGGASGMLCAVQLKRLNPSLSVAVLERQARVGRKLLATGNGRCNLTNMNLSPAHYPAGAGFIEPALKRFPPGEVLLTFESLGLFCAADAEGRVYPLSGQAASVLDALRLAMDELGVQVLTGFEVIKLARGFELYAADGRALGARRVVLAAGGPAGGKLGGTVAAHKLAAALSHPVTKCTPALTQLKTDPDRVRALKGIRASCRASLRAGGRPLETARGEILFTEYGLSGIAAMALGRTAALLLSRGERAEVALALTNFDGAEARRVLTQLRGAVPDRALEDFLSGLLPKRLGQTLLKHAGISPLSRTASTLTDAELLALSLSLTDWRLPITGTRGFDDAQVTAGGLDTRYFSSATLESTLTPGLYAVGEALDVDGPCGGYNLHWAWASALTAAVAASSATFKNGRTHF